MKFKSLIIIASMVSGLGFASCTSDAPEYDPAAPLATPEVYFSNSDEGQSFEIGEEVTSFSVTAYRADDAAAATYPLTVTGTDVALFTYPSSVSFAAGEDEATFDVTCDGAKLTPAKKYEITFSVGEGKDYPYYCQSLTFTTTVLPWEDVVGPNGETMGLFTDVCLAQMYGVPSLEWPVKIQSSPVNPGLYRVVDPYGPTSAWYSQGTYAGPTYLYFNIKDKEFGYLCDKNGVPATATEPTKFYTGFTINDDEGEVYFTTWFNVMLYANELTIEDVLGNASLQGQLLSGAITYVDGLVTIPKMRTKLTVAHAGTSETAWVNVSLPGLIKFPGYVEPSQEETGWVSAGKAQFTDPWINALYQVTTVEEGTWEVDVEKSADNIGAFRLVNTYKSTGNCPFGFDYDGDLYIEIDATDPTCVLVPLCNTGLVDEADGDVYVCNIASILKGNGQTIADIIAAGRADVYDESNLTITIGGSNAGFNFPNAANEEDRNKIYTANKPIEGKIVLSEEATAQYRQAMIHNYIGNFRGVLKSHGYQIKSYTTEGKHAVKKVINF